MKRLLIPLIAVLIVGCDIEVKTNKEKLRCPKGKCPASPPADCPYMELPPMDLPVELRQRNYSGGSCVHASLVSVLRWQNLHTFADWWQSRYRGGESLGGLVAKAEDAGMRFAFTGSGDEQFLEWCSRTRRGAVIFYYSSHSISFCGFMGGSAVVMDNNNVERLIHIPKAEFLQRWRGYGGVAFTPVYTPSPPLPWIPQTS